MRSTDKTASTRKYACEDMLNSIFIDDESLMRAAWSLSSYIGMDACTPVYVLI